jgi:poly-gamma-glutamate capsule biosynthesis protein CapA/YwtB (metallophosphatase superfamily)
MRKAVLLGAAVAATFVLCCAAGLQAGCAADDGRSQTEGSIPGPSTTALSAAQPPSTEAEAAVEITIAAAGDIMVHGSLMRAAKAAGTGGAYDFRPTFAPIAPYLRIADYTLVNLETRLAGADHPYTTYPRFNSPGEIADALAWAGVDLVATANNHTLDKRWDGVVKTLARLDEAGLAHVGTARDMEEKKATSPLIVDIKGIKVAFINYTDYLNEFTPPKDHKEYAVNFLKEASQVAEEAALARQGGAEVVIAILHWGREYTRQPNEKQSTYTLGSDTDPGLLAQGVDVILGSHPHAIQPAVCVPQKSASGTKNAYVVYSMGNFISGMEGRYNNGGAIVYVHIRKQGTRVEVTGLSYMGAFVQTFGPYPRKVRLLPVLPGADPGEGIVVTPADQKRMDLVWGDLTELFYNTDTNVVPLDPNELGSTRD